MKQWTVKWTMDAKNQPRIKARSPGSDHKVTMSAPILGWITTWSPDPVSKKDHFVQKTQAAFERA
jgi:hypothetical protein